MGRRHRDRHAVRAPAHHHYLGLRRCGLQCRRHRLRCAGDPDPSVQSRLVRHRARAPGRRGDARSAGLRHRRPCLRGGRAPRCHLRHRPRCLWQSRLCRRHFCRPPAARGLGRGRRHRGAACRQCDGQDRIPARRLRRRFGSGQQSAQCDPDQYRLSLAHHGRHGAARHQLQIRPVCGPRLQLGGDIRCAAARASAHGLQCAGCGIVDVDRLLFRSECRLRCRQIDRRHARERRHARNATACGQLLLHAQGRQRRRADRLQLAGRHVACRPRDRRAILHPAHLTAARSAPARSAIPALRPWASMLR